MSWFFLGMIHRAVALDRAQSPSDTVSIENDEMPLRNVVDILSNEVKTRWRTHVTAGCRHGSSAI